MSKKRNDEKELEKKIIGFKDVELIEALSARCRRKYKRAKTPAERDKYDRFLELINERIDIISEEIRAEMEQLKQKKEKEQ